jgi:hypothetical protein
MPFQKLLVVKFVKNVLLDNVGGSAITQAVSYKGYMLPTPAAPVRPQPRSRGICGRQNVTWRCFLLVL